jgi:excisionase family DNA binding protein
VLTITEAANQTGLTRAAIHKAIKSGRLSATKDDSGNFQIDAAELFRVYQPVLSTGLQETINLPETAEYQLIAQRLEFTESRLITAHTHKRYSLHISEWQHTHGKQTPILANQMALPTSSGHSNK